MEPEVSRVVHAPLSAVWRVLSNGWQYSGWVVGASRIRDVDDEFPSAGARLHQSVGLWPVLINDFTTIVSCEPQRRLELQARGRPLGEARVVITLERLGSKQTRVTMWEEVAKGPGKLVPHDMLAKMIKWRNTESLRRLAHLAERGAGNTDGTAQSTTHVIRLPADSAERSQS